MIELTKIVKTFQAGAKQVDAVKDVTLTIEDGEIFGIIGFSGAGKSTLVRCINLLGKPNSGSVKIDGTDLMTLSPKDLREERKKIGMIFQHFNLMPSRTVFGNVAFPLKGSGLTKQEIKDKVRKLLSMVDLADKENAYPSELSGGQKQRVAIARALANDPKILLSDEATSALDPQTTGSILRLLKKLNKELGITIVVITHEMEVIKEICNRVAVMEDGEVVESGDVFDIFADPKHPLTKNFIKTTSNLAKIDQMVEDNVPGVTPEQGEVLAKLSYRQKDVAEPLISTAAKQFDLNINIVLADVEIISGSPIGGTVVILHGESDLIDDAIKYFRAKNVGVEVIKDARNPF